MNKKRSILLNIDVLRKESSKIDINIEETIDSEVKSFIKKISQKYKIILLSKYFKINTIKWLKRNQIDTYIYEITTVFLLLYLYIDKELIEKSGGYNKLLEIISIVKK